MLQVLSKWASGKKAMCSKFAIEFIASAMFHFIGSVSPTPIANGVALMTLVYYTAKISGAHINPAISLTFTVLGYTNPLEMLGYWIAQVSGCAFGAIWISALVPGLKIGQDIKRIAGGEAYDGCFVPADGLDKFNTFGWEALCTFNFIIPIFSVVWYTHHKAGYGNTGPLIIGLSLLANALVAGPFTGAALNPARAIGSQIVFVCPKKEFTLYYVLGELLAGLLAPMLIVPWYGISTEAWFLEFLSKKTIIKFREYQGSIKMSATQMIESERNSNTVGQTVSV
jgi:glycerol uptake facilitator-like aquaporin